MIHMCTAVAVTYFTAPAVYPAPRTTLRALGRAKSLTSYEPTYAVGLRVRLLSTLTRKERIIHSNRPIINTL